MLVTKYLDNKVLYHIYPQGEIIPSLAWAIGETYHHNIMDTTGQAVFGIEMEFNLASVIYWQVVTAVKKLQVDINNFIEKSRRVTHECAIGNLVHVEITGIYHKLDYKFCTMALNLRSYTYFINLRTECG